MNRLSEYVSAGISLIVVIGVMVLVVLQRPVPVELWAGFGLVLGFFFGHQAGAGAMLARMK